jgi:hypothetical protein
MTAVGIRDANAVPERERHWTFLSNHAHVLVLLDADPGMRVRDIAGAIGITERAAQRILADLEHEGYIHRSRTGRRTHYDIHLDRPMRHPVEADVAVGRVIGAVRVARSAPAATARVEVTSSE